MTSPQLEFYAAERAGRTAIIHTETGSIIAWVEQADGALRARRGRWTSEPVATIPALIALVAQHHDTTTD